MTEKWMQSKSNPYIGRPLVRRPMVRKRARVQSIGRFNQPSNIRRTQRVIVKIPTRKRFSAYSKQVAAHHGMPIQMFKDSDKDNVINVIDCQPFNKKKQDVIMPRNFGGGIQDMYSRREQGRQARFYERQLKELQRQEQQRLLELQRINTPVAPIYKTYNVSGSGSYSSALKATDTPEKIADVIEGDEPFSVTSYKVNAPRLTSPKPSPTPKITSYTSTPLISAVKKTATNVWRSIFRKRR